MSHYSLFAIGFEDEEELEEMMSFYDENLKTIPHVYKTKEDIIQLGKKKYKERCSLIESYSSEPEKTIEEYGVYVKELYENRDKDGMFNYYKDPEDYYKWFVSGQKTDRNGNLLSNDNPNSKWDYYSVERETTIGELKKEFENARRNFDPSRYEYIWDTVVNGTKPEKMDLNHFMLLWNVPSKEKMLELYKTKEEYISFQRNMFCPSYSVLLPEGWFEPGTVVSFGMSTASADEEHIFRKDYYKNFIEPFSDDTIVYVIDCHI